MNNCPTCYPHIIASCTETIQIKSSTISYGQYTATVTDKFGNVFVTYAASTGGIVSIDLAELPPYLFNSFGGTFQIQLYGDKSCVPINFKFCGLDYTCIQVKVVEVRGDEHAAIAYIPCCAGDDDNTNNYDGYYGAYAIPTVPDPYKPEPPKQDPPPPPSTTGGGNPGTTYGSGTSLSGTGGSGTSGDITTPPKDK